MQIETVKIRIKSCALCPFRMQVGLAEIKEKCWLLPEVDDLEYSIVPLGRHKECPLPKKIKFDI